MNIPYIWDASKSKSRLTNIYLRATIIKTKQIITVLHL